MFTYLCLAYLSHLYPGIITFMHQYITNDIGLPSTIPTWNGLPYEIKKEPSPAIVNQICYVPRERHLIILTSVCISIKQSIIKLFYQSTDQSN